MYIIYKCLINRNIKIGAKIRAYTSTTTSTSACQVQSDHGGSLPPWSDQLRSGGAFKKRETARVSRPRP